MKFQYRLFFVFFYVFFWENNPLVYNVAKSTIRQVIFFLLVITRSGCLAEI